MSVLLDNFDTPLARLLLQFIVIIVACHEFTTSSGFAHA